jgi:predicted TPR repeat methyltransferase
MLVEARVCFEKAAAVAPDDSQVPYQLAMLDRAEGRDSGVDTAPRAYVSSLFDYYASNDYDAHLLSLEYRGPQLLWEAFDRQQQQQPPRVGCLADLKVLEIGCGSGLVGRYFRERGCGYSFEGCDLSPVMVRTAKDAIFTKPPGDDPTNIDMVYSKVVEGDAATFLSTHSAGAHNNNEGDRGADLVLAGDVLCYIGRLDELFASVGSSLRDGGLFIFTVEAGTEKARGVGDAWKSAGFTLRSTGRFAHSQAYIEALAEAHGMKVERMHAEMLRRDGTESIHGFVCTLERQKN